MRDRLGVGAGTAICLLVGTLLIAVGAGLAWWFILRPIVGAGSAVVQGARDWARTADAETSASVHVLSSLMSVR